jgi:hypothetical protein
MKGVRRIQVNLPARYKDSLPEDEVLPGKCPSAEVSILSLGLV